MRAQPEASVKAQLARRARHVVPGRTGCSVAREVAAWAHEGEAWAHEVAAWAHEVAAWAHEVAGRANVAPGRVREGVGIEIERGVDEADPVAAPQRLARREREVGPG